MAGRTFAIGDIHGELSLLKDLLARIGTLDADDTIVFMGDYVDRGPQSRQVIEFIRFELPKQGMKIVTLRGNHEDAWLRVMREGWDGFVLPPGNGCLACLRSFTGGPPPRPAELPREDELDLLSSGGFFPADVVAWMESLPYWHEDEHAIYVHAGLPRVQGRFLHPRDVPQPVVLLWLRTEEFFRDYRGKAVLVGHTVTSTLPPELSSYYPEDPTDLWAGECVIAIDTGCGKGGFLTSVELPELFVWESREPLKKLRKKRLEAAERAASLPASDGQAAMGMPKL